MMKKFIVSFLAILLISSTVPLYLYLNAPKEPEQASPEVPEQTEPQETAPTEPESSEPIPLNKFSSYEELKTFLETAASSPNNYWLGRGEPMIESFDSSTAVPSAPVEPEPSQTEGPDYSETNIQVEGVDEADIIKTDGEYIYIVSGGNITIVKAYPPEEAKVLSKISLNGSITGIFINGNKLVVFETEYGIYPLYEITVDDSASIPEPENGSTPVEEPSRDPSEPTIEPAMPEPITPIIYEPPTTSIKVYDISDKENPVLTRNFSIDGNYFSSRMIGDYVYVVATQYTFFIEKDVFLPRVHSDNETEAISATDIYYYNSSDISYSFTSIVALNVQNDAQEPTHETILLGGTSAIYVSQSNIYLVFPDYTWEENETMKTVIQRIKIENDSIIFAAEGEVPGYVLNQFSMDEHNGYFRIATTVENFNWRTFDEEATSKNNVYVLDMNLNIVGKLEDLALGETIYSARFMGDRGYLVTFRQVDPLFVIDLQDPTNPKVLGQLKVTGYSDYLHPYDENHLIGIGKETNLDKDNPLYQGVKISLFDASDVSNPVELAKYEIGDRGTDSPVLWDHKALLFDKEKNLLVIPVLVAEIDPSQYEGDVPAWAYGEYVWQGAYVFDISLDGLELRGRITHMEDSDDLLKSGFWFYSEYAVERSLYIDNVLYTISNMKLKMNNLETLAEINSVNLS